MVCPDYLDRIMELQEATLPARDRQAVEDHLRGCEPCRRFAQRLEQLDTAMTASCSAPGLSADFKARLMQRLDLEAVVPSKEAIDARKRDLEAEYRTTMAGLARTVWRAHLPLLLDVLGLVAMAGIAVLVLRSALGGRVSVEAVVGLMIKASTGTLAWAWAVGGTAAALLIAFGTRSRRRMAGL
jgi:hypothetical protein